MARRLRRNVVAGGVTHPAGTAETAELAKVVSNPRAWEGEPNPAPAPPPAPVPEGESGAPAEPPRAGRGSSEAAWRVYAESRGIEVPEGAGRDDIIALVDDR